MFEETHFFGRKIQTSLVSANQLAGRLLDATDRSFLPFPFVLSPARKSLLENFLPLPQSKISVIEGFSQAGKSNFGCHLALLYRMHKEKVVMYIGNMAEFRQFPSQYVLNEIFYWFYEEIAADPIFQNAILETLSAPLNKKSAHLESLLSSIIQLVQENGKTVILVVDQFNLKKDDGEAEYILDLLSRLANWRIYVTINTDTKINLLKRSDFGDSKTLVLDENKNQISVHELSKLIMKIIPKCTKDVAEVLVSKMECNLNLIFLFCNFYVGKKFLKSEEADFLKYYDEFSENYIRENQLSHGRWSFEEAQTKSKFDPDFMSKLKNVMLLLNTKGSVQEYTDDLIDKRYLYIENNRLFSINHLIEKMFKRIYWTANQLEAFLNTYGSQIGGSAFGTLFEFYLILKMQEMNKKGDPLELQLSNGKLFKFTFQKDVKQLRYGEKYANAISKKYAKEKGRKHFNLITYEQNLGKPTENLLHETPQDNFPFIEFELTEFQPIIHNKFSVKLDGKLIASDTYKSHFERYCGLYGDQANEQLGNYFFVFSFNDFRSWNPPNDLHLLQEQKKCDGMVPAKHEFCHERSRSGVR